MRVAPVRRRAGSPSGILRSVPVDDLFLPEPEPREVRYTVISVDDHVVEPAHTFEGRVPAALADRAPRIVETPEGHQVWEFEGERYTQVGMNAVAGRRPETYGLEPFRFDQMRPGCYDVDARVRDMDINGVWASVNFPSMITGFCGRVFFDAKDRDLGLACIRAWNDWLFEEWYSRSSRAHRPARDHLPRRPDPRRGGDPPQRGPGLHVGDVPRAAARDRAALAVGQGTLGPDHGGRRRHRHRDLAARRAARASPRPHPGPASTRCTSGPRSSASCRSRRAPSGCGPATRSDSPTSRSP